MSASPYLSPRRLFRLAKESFAEWNRDKALRLGAALSFYTIVSLPPMLVILVAAAAVVFGKDAVRERIVTQLGGLIGDHGRELISGMLSGQSRPRSSVPASIFGVLLLVFGASGVFAQLRDALNTIWHVEEKPGGGIAKIVKERIFSFNILLAVGFLLVVSLAVSALLVALTSWWGGWFQGFEFILAILDFVVSVGVLTLCFALLFRFVPDTRVAWRDVWVGSALTAVLFSVGKVAIGFYLGKSSVGAAYGASGPLVVLLFWIYYSAQIFFLGAEFTKVFANRYGSRLQPEKPDAKRAPAEARVAPTVPAGKGSARKRPRRGPGHASPWRALAWRIAALFAGFLLVDRFLRKDP